MFETLVLSATEIWCVSTLLIDLTTVLICFHDTHVYHLMSEDEIFINWDELRTTKPTHQKRNGESEEISCLRRDSHFLSKSWFSVCIIFVAATFQRFSIDKVSAYRDHKKVFNPYVCLLIIKNVSHSHGVCLLISVLIMPAYWDYRSVLIVVGFDYRDCKRFIVLFVFANWDCRGIFFQFNRFLTYIRL